MCDKDVQEREGRWEESPRMNVLRKENRGMISVLVMMVARSGKRYLPSFSTEGWDLKKVAWWNWSARAGRV